MSRKPRSDSILDNLLPDQLKTLEAWLFEKNISYASAVKRCVKQFKVKPRVESFPDFYRKVAMRRAIERILRSTKDANAILDAFNANPADMLNAVAKMLAHLTFEMTLDPKTKPDARVLQDVLKLLAPIRKDDLSVKQFAFTREKWEFDVGEVIAKKGPEIKVISTNPKISYKEKIRQIRMELFGRAPE